MPTNESAPSSIDTDSSTAPYRCEPDPLNSAVICTAKDTNDDRQGISHFFGRNKKATHSIPDGIFPVLCRTHYQEKQFRWKHHPASLAAFQCDCVLRSLERMAPMIWTDEQGLEWPKWCGFELQTQKEPDPDKTRAGAHFVPDWLRKLCSKEATGQEFVSVGDRGGARYNFPQLVKVVLAIKSWCLEKNMRLPSVEALPITIGMVNEVDLEEAKSELRAATREFNLVNNQLSRAGGRNRNLQKAVERAQDDVELAQETMEIAQQDAETTISTLPVAKTKKVRKQDSPHRLTLKVDLKRKRSGKVVVSRKKVKVYDGEDGE